MLLTLGISHKTAPIHVREKLAFSQENIPMALNALWQAVPLEEVALLSTCNRTEIYCSTALKSPRWVDEVVTWWQTYLATNVDLTPYLYSHAEIHAVKHVLRVASGLDSMVLGEPQILGQLKSAFRTANQTGLVGRKLCRLFQSSFSTAKKIRATTHIATYPVSIAFAAVSLAKQIFTDLSKASVVLIGAGENTELILQHLVAKQVKRLVIVNRTVSKAKMLAKRYGADFCALSELSQCLSQADVVVSSVASAAPILKQEHIDLAFEGAKRRPLLMIDLGVPRNIEPSLAQNEDIYLYSVDDLDGIISQNKRHRESAAADAESIILHATDDYMNWIDSENQIKTIRVLRQKANYIKEEALQRAYKRLEKGQDPKVVVEIMLHQLTQKLMHTPTVKLRGVKPNAADEKIVLAKELFNLE